MASDWHESLDIRVFARSTFERSLSLFQQVTKDLSDEQLNWRPSQETNSIAWLAWHLSRRKDYYTSRLVGDEEAWRSAGWYERFALTPAETGLGHTAEDVVRFRPSRELLFAYFEGANRAALSRLERLDPSTLNEVVDLDAGRGTVPRSRIWNPMISDCLQHLGQIAYLRGVITGRGWFSV